MPWEGGVFQPPLQRFKQVILRSEKDSSFARSGGKGFVEVKLVSEIPSWTAGGRTKNTGVQKEFNVDLCLLPLVTAHVALKAGIDV